MLSRLLFGIFCLASFTIFSQESLTKSQWQEDLRYLQETVHREFPILFKKVTKEDWDKTVETFYNEIPTLEPHEIKVGMVRMVSFFQYGHTQIRFDALAENGVLPVNFYDFKDGLYIEGLQKKDSKALGAKVIAIGETPIADALKAIRPVVPVENDQYFRAYGIRFLRLPSVLHAQSVLPSLSDTVTFTLEKEGRQFTHTFTALPLADTPSTYGFTVPNESWTSVRDWSSTPLYLKHLDDRLYYFEYVPEDKVMYVRQSSVFNDEKESLADFYERLFKAVDSLEVDKLVYDVRLNGGGNNYNNKPLIKAIMARPEINQKGKFFYITGRQTFSAAQNLTNEIVNYTEAIIVGEPTAENLNFLGDARPVRLPNSGMEANLSYAWWQDFPQWENKDFTIPNLYAEMTFDQYRTNDDPVLETALSYTDTGFILDPLQHLTDLFSQGKMDQLLEDATRVARDPAYKFIDFEEEFSTSAYRLLQAGQNEMALSIYGFVAQIYPESSGALYNLASAFETAGDKEKAKAFYEKIITLNNNKVLVNTAQKRLAALKTSK